MKIVAQKLSMANFDGLRGLVKDQVIESVRNVIDSMTEKQREQLYITSDDICKQTVSGIEVKPEGGQVLVEISMVYHLVKGFKDLTDGKVEPKEFFNKTSQ